MGSTSLIERLLDKFAETFANNYFVEYERLFREILGTKDELAEAKKKLAEIEKELSERTDPANAVKAPQRDKFYYVRLEENQKFKTEQIKSLEYLIEDYQRSIQNTRIRSANELHEFYDLVIKSFKE